MKLDAFTFDFKETEWGWFNLHAYRFDDDWSTFIIEAPEEVWLKAGIDKMSRKSPSRCASGSSRTSRRPSADFECKAPARFGHLAEVQPNSLREVVSQKHRADRRCRAHCPFQHRLGTKLAMEDAIALSRVLSEHTGEVCDALQRYQMSARQKRSSCRAPRANRMEWFEQVERYVHLDVEQFTYSLLTGSQRIGHENLKLRDANYVQGVEQWFAARSGVHHAVPPMFTPFPVRA